MAQLHFHPVSKDLPQLRGKELDSLRLSIQTSGLLEPIILLDGLILDGRARYEICRDLSIPLKINSPAFAPEENRENFLFQALSGTAQRARDGKWNMSQRAVWAATIELWLREDRRRIRIIRRSRLRQLRRLTPNSGPQQDCFICGKYRWLTESHHVCPISDYADEISSNPSAQQTVWLCPICHKLLHRVRANSNFVFRVADYLALEQWNNLQQILDLEKELVRRFTL